MMGSDPYGPPKLDTSVPHPARRYNYWLGGKDHFEADRVSGDAIAAMFPGVRASAIENRRFLQRGVTFLVGECGVRQFLDIGTGLPTADNTHEIAQRIAPESRIVYVDNDPLVMVHARALLTSAPEGVTAYIEQDLDDTKAVLDEARMVLDFDRPIALLLVAVMHFISDDNDACEAVAELRDALPPGSYLLLSHVTGDPFNPRTQAAWDQAIASGRHGDFRYRNEDEVLKILDGWDLLAPGLVPVAQWRPDPDSEPVAFADAAVYAAVARKI
ncbi:hypothetical protein Vau01_121050 [Virgisporangium aurantiacum]|uniref:S-adenosyl methyltransferase n=1 Tax=Virgisporangium aurantiacum TaxID=175570 RepID=A0A8J3ZIN0_9ACTN|nr:hypothetical protein Vau01_121050 [Virgisporangium aurantiacum]